MTDRRATPVGEALDAYFARTGIKRRIAQAAAVDEWETIVGPTIAEVTTPLSVSADGVLFVAVSSSAWMQELQLMSPSILRQLHDRGKRIKRIVWKAG